MDRAKTVLITGATAGIGKHAALHLARQGFHVFATGRRKEALAELKAQTEGLKLETFELDVTDPESVKAAVAEVDRSTNGYGLDALVNNAGYGMLGPLEMISDEDLKAQYETNVFGLMAMTRAFLPKMRERGAGRIVNVSSTGGRMTFPFMGAYNSTKYAVESLSDALRSELHPFGVKVVLIEPGYIHTEFAERAMKMTSKYDVPDSPYAAMFRRVEKARKGFEATGVGPECVSRAIERAIVGRSPLARYVVPLRTYVGLALAKGLPTRAADFLMRAILGLNKR
jgi:NAD(P)-dependent dehydrogenase (short-subunit alcohol dehydrogenase family)